MYKSNSKKSDGSIGRLKKCWKKEKDWKESSGLIWGGIKKNIAPESRI